MNSKLSFFLLLWDVHVASVEEKWVQSIVLPPLPEEPWRRLPAEEDHDEGEDGGGDVAARGQPPGQGGPTQHTDEEARGVADHGEDTAGSPQVGVGDLGHEDRAGHQVTAGAVPGQKTTSIDTCLTSYVDTLLHYNDPIDKIEKCVTH